LLEGEDSIRSIGGGRPRNGGLLEVQVTNFR